MLYEKSSYTTVEKLPAINFYVWMPLILFLATFICYILGKVARLAQKLAALKSDLKLFPSRLILFKSKKF